MKIVIRLAIMALVLTAAFPASAQRGKKNVEQIELPAFPMIEGKVVYTGVVEAKGTSAELYAKSLAWFKSHYKNPSNVIQSQDPDAGIIIGKHRFPTFAVDPKTGQEIRGPLTLYTIKIMSKDGRFKYDITEIKQKDATNIPIEKLVIEQRKNYMQGRAQHLVQMDDHLTSVAADLKKNMTAAAAAKADDW